MYCIGIDGGGTKSRLMAQDRAGKVYGPLEGGATNLNSNPEPVVRENLRELVGRFLQQQRCTMQQVDALAIGSAGVDIPQNAQALEVVLRAAGITCPLRVVNDVEIVLEGETQGGPGMVLIAGTGSVGVGKNAQGTVRRVGGWGHVAGDEGSGYWLGREAVRHAFLDFDHRGPPTLLRPLLEKECGLASMDEMMRVIYREGSNKSELAALSRVAEAAAAQGDAVASALFEQAADDLLQMARALQQTLGLSGEFPLALSGGILTGSEQMAQRLLPLLRGITPRVYKANAPPAMGAVRLAQQLFEQGAKA